VTSTRSQALRTNARLSGEGTDSAEREPQAEQRTNRQDQSAGPSQARWAARLLRGPAGTRVAGIIFVLIVLGAILAQWLTPVDPLVQNLQRPLHPPTWSWTGWRNPGRTGTYLLGSDELGRDVLSRILWGIRLSLAISSASVVFAMLLGVTLGVATGLRRGALDAAIMMFTDMWLSFPPILLAIVIVAGLGSGLINTVLVLILTNWATYTRVIRSEVLSLREREFVLAARALGSGPRRIAVRHIIPQVIPTALTLATLQFGIIVILEATLSFLGLGVPRPAPSLGNLLADGRQFLWTAWWLTIFPGLTVTALVWSSNILGDWVRDLVDPRLRL